MTCETCGADWEAILDWKEGQAKRDAEVAALRAELERTKLARNQADARASRASPPPDPEARRLERKKVQAMMDAIEIESDLDRYDEARAALLDYVCGKEDADGR